MNVLEARRVLGVGVMASPEDVTRAYRKRVYVVHPDRNPRDPRAGEKVVRLTEAYAVMKHTAGAPPRAYRGRGWTRSSPAWEGRGPAWDWFHADDAAAVGDPQYRPGTDPLTDLINDMRNAVRGFDPEAANIAVGAALGMMIAFMSLRK